MLQSELNMIESLDGLLISWGVDLSDVWIRILAFCLILLLAYIADFICRRVMLRVVHKIVSRTKVTWDDIVFDSNVMKKFVRLVPPIVVYVFMPIVFSIKSHEFVIAQRIIFIYFTIVSVRAVEAVFKALFHVYSNQKRFKNRPLKGLLQTIQVVLYLIGGIIVVSILMDKSPMVLLTTLGASAAVLMLVFKDSIMGFVSGIQLSANDMLKVGDWISMPKYGADGVVVEVTLNTVKVRNWDNTIITIPPYLLVSDSFQNWRGMSESAGRRVKRSINIDMTSVCFCTDEMLQRFSRIHLLKEYIDRTENKFRCHNEKHKISSENLVNGLRQTNLGIFRAYLTNYLRSLPEISNNMTCMVRQLQPTEKGIPLELYCFSTVKEWTGYEKIQSDIFDHVLAVIPEFKLRVFQNLSGSDIKMSLQKMKSESKG